MYEYEKKMGRIGLLEGKKIVPIVAPEEIDPDIPFCIEWSKFYNQPTRCLMDNCSDWFYLPPEEGSKDLPMGVCRKIATLLLKEELIETLTIEVEDDAKKFAKALEEIDDDGEYIQ